MHSFHTYIDESGDDGFVFKDWPGRASSEWFVMSACFVRSAKHSEASQGLHQLLDPIEAVRKAPIHFHKLYHEQRVAITHGLAKLPMRIITICFNKRLLQPGHTLAGHRRLYFYCTRYLLERISWLARDSAAISPGDGRCKLHFSACKGLSYAKLGVYFADLQQQGTSIEWPHIDAAKFDIQGHADSIWLRAADCVSTSFARAVELSEHGFCEDRYARMLKPVVYRHRLRYMSYGLKVFPNTPAVESERDNRYDWLSLYR